MRRVSWESIAVLWALQPAASMTTRQQKTIRERDKQTAFPECRRLSHSARLARTSGASDLKRFYRWLRPNAPPRYKCPVSTELYLLPKSHHAFRGRRNTAFSGLVCDDSRFSN